MKIKREVMYFVLLLFFLISSTLCLDQGQNIAFQDVPEDLEIDLIFDTLSFGDMSSSPYLPGPSSFTPTTHCYPTLSTTATPTTAGTPLTSSDSPSITIPTTNPPPSGKPDHSISFEEALILYVTIPVMCLLVIIAFIIALVLCIRRYKRIRKYRLHLMPLHNMDGSDDEDDDHYDDGDEDDKEAAFTISSMGGRQPILQFAESP